MLNYLRDYARRAIWCAPRQDLSTTWRPARLTAPRGVMGFFEHGWDRLPLPNKNQRWHVYQIGQIDPDLLGLIDVPGSWVCLARLFSQTNLLSEVYLDNGRMLFREDCWVLKTQDRNLLVAVAEQRNIADLTNQPIYVHFYSNAYFDSPRSNGLAVGLSYRSLRASTTTTTSAFRTAYYTSRDSGVGMTSLFINGDLRDDFRLADIKTGDLLEFVYDGSVMGYQDYPVSELQTYHSILDARLKYLLHLPPEHTPAGLLYQDDVTVYGTWGTGKDLHGRLLHKNAVTTLRNVTHRDFGLPSQNLELLNVEIDEAVLTDFSVRMIWRNSGFDRPLAFDHRRIHELYKLPDDQILPAMSGTQMNAQMWDAALLEASPYATIMRARWRDIDGALAQNALGYHAATKVLADSPAVPLDLGGVLQVTLSPGLSAGATVFEYDAQGVLLGHYTHPEGTVYLCRHTDCALIEAQQGIGQAQYQAVIGDAPVTLDQSRYVYRYYTAPKGQVGGTHVDWTDVTDTQGLYTLHDGQLEWVPDLGTIKMVRSDAAFLLYDLPVSYSTGLIKFRIHSAVTQDASNSGDAADYLQPGKLTLWLNGHALVEDIDYTVRWPDVVICNKEYRKPSGEIVTICCTGFADAQLRREPAVDTGYVKYGQLSRNATFNLRDDRVQRIIARGRVFSRAAVSVSEDQLSTISQVPNGSPYAIDNVYVSIPDTVGITPAAYRQQSYEVDRMVSDYLTARIPEPDYPYPDVIPERYAIYSPFLSAVLFGLTTGVLPTTQFQGQYSDQAVREFLHDYEYLLPYDPAYQCTVDPLRVCIHPHGLTTTIEVDLYQYNLLSRAAHTYLDDRVDLSQFLTIKPTWV